MRCRAPVLRMLALLGLAAAWAAPAHAQWRDLATISSTMGNNAGYVCTGAGRTDLGCALTAPFVTASGALGIGTTTPSSTLHVNGTARFENVVNFTSAAQITAVSTSSIAINSNRHIYLMSPVNGGTFIGVNTLTPSNIVPPSTTLHVSGTIRIANSGENCDANRLGAIRYAAGSVDICRNITNGWEPLATTGANSAIDRITSNSMAGVTANDTGYISLTTGGVTGTVYFTPSGNLVNSGISTTGTISGTSGYLGNLRLGQTGAFTNAISPFQSYGDIVGDYAGIGGLELRNINGGPNADFRFVISDDRGSNGSTLNFSMSSSNNTNTLFGQPRNQLATLFVNGSTDANARALAIGTLKAHPLIFGTNNNEAMRIISTGFVGIGGNTPNLPLDVSGSTRIRGALYLGSTTPTSRIYGVDTATYISMHWGSPDITFNTNGLRRMTVASTNLGGEYGGRVGIGSMTYPSTTLDVSGSVKLRAEPSGNAGETCDTNRLGAIRYTSGSFDVCRNATNGWEPLATATSATDIAINTGLSGSLVFRDELGKLKARNDLSVSSTTGSVGIGAGAPASLGNNSLYAAGNIRAVATVYGGVFTTNGVTGGYYWAGNNVGIVGNSDALQNYMSFTTSSTEAMRIVSSGYVGVGISNPLAPLHVSGSILTSYNQSRLTLRPWESGSDQGVDINTGGTGFTKYSMQLMANSRRQVVITTSGTIIGNNLPTNNTAYTPLDINGTLRIANSGESCDTNRLGAIRYSSGSGSFDICRNTTNGWEPIATSTSATDISINTGLSGSIVFRDELGKLKARNDLSVSSTTGSVGIGAGAPASLGNSGLYVSGSLQTNTDLILPYGNTLRVSGFAYNTLFQTGWNGFADYLALFTAGNGTENLGPKIVVLSNGNIGMGTATPTNALDISGTLRLISSPLSCDTNHVGAIRFISGSFDVCRNTSNGWEPLAISGVSSTQDRITSGTTQMITYNNASATIATNGVERVVVGTNGNVGIGTNTPSTTLHVIGLTTLSSNTAIAAQIDVATPLNIGGQMSDPSLSRSIRIQDATGNLAGYIGSTGETSTANKLVLFGNRGTGGIQLRTSNAYTMNLLPNGLVGISTTDPSTSLHVMGAVRLGNEASTTLQACDTNRLGAMRYTSGSFDICRNTTNGWEPIATSTSATDIAINTGLSGSLVFRDELGKLKAYDTFAISATTGSVGIGAGASANVGNNGLYATGGIETATNMYANKYYVRAGGGMLWSDASNLSITGVGGATTKYMVFTTSGTEAMRIVSTGYVGIGTPTPTTNFEVLGDQGGGMAMPLSVRNSVAGGAAGFQATNSAGTTMLMGIGNNSNGSGLRNRGYIGFSNAAIPLIINSKAVISTGAAVNVSGPSTTLDISGTLKIANSGESCDTDRLGALRYNSGSFDVCRNTSNGWEPIATATSATDIAINTGLSGSLVFRDDLGKLKARNDLSVSSTTGSVGIGAGAPATLGNNALYVSGTGYMANGLLVGNTSTNAKVTSGADGNTFISLHWGQPDITFHTNNLRRMTIASSNLGAEYAGRIGIGSMTYPSTTLHVSGTLKISNAGETCDANRLGAIRYTSGAFSVCANTSNGWEPLATTTGSASGDRIISGTTGMYTYNNTSASIATNGVERVVVGTNGNVGIAQQPATGVALSISGSTSISGRLGVLTPSGSNVMVGNLAGSNASGSENTGIGQGAFQNSSGDEGVAIGRYTGQWNTGNETTFIGSGSGLANAGNSVVGIGYNALQNNSASTVVAVGVNAGQENRPAGANASFLGNNSGQFNSGAFAAAVGMSAAQRNSGANLSAIGGYAAQFNSGADVVAIGYNAAQFNSGAGLVALGQLAANKNTAAQVTAIGYNAVSTVSNTYTNITGLGYDAQPTKSNQVMLGNTLTEEVATSGAGVFGLHVRVGSATTALMTSATIVGPGAIMYDSTLNALRYSNGTQWNTVGTGSASGDRIVSGTTGMYTYSNTSATIVTAGVERLIVATNGNIGIAQQPENNVPLAVSGTIKFNNGVVAIQNNNSSIGLIQGVPGNNALGSDYERFQIRTPSTSQVTYFENGYSGTGLARDFAFFTSGADRLRIKTDGKIGINNSSPSVMLDVQGALRIGARAISSTSIASVVLPSQGAYMSWNQDNGLGRTNFMNHPGIGGGGFDFSMFDSSGTFVSTPMVINHQANVGIGMTGPTTKLNVSGTLRIASGGESCDTSRLGSIKYEAGAFSVCETAGSWSTLTTSAGGAASDRITSGTTGMYTYNNTSATIATNGVERMVIGTNGNVGIAQQPMTGYNLAVSGTSYFNGDINHTGSIYGTSDARLKTNVTNITRAVDTLSQLRPVSFEFKARRGHTEYGFLAQEVQKVYPALVNKAKDTSGTLSVNYTGLIAPMVQGLTEVNAEVKQLKDENAKLRNELEAMRAEIRAIAKQQAIAHGTKAP